MEFIRYSGIFYILFYLYLIIYFHLIKEILCDKYLVFFVLVLRILDYLKTFILLTYVINKQNRILEYRKKAKLDVIILIITGDVILYCTFSRIIAWIRLVLSSRTTIEIIKWLQIIEVYRNGQEHKDYKIKYH